MSELKYIPFYPGYMEDTSDLSDSEFRRLMYALCDYCVGAEQPEPLTGKEVIAYRFITRNIKVSQEQYTAKCRKNSENAKKRTIANDSERKHSQANDSERKHSQANDSETSQYKEQRTKNKEQNISFVSNDTQDICNAESVATRKRAPAYSAKKAIEDYTQDPELRELLIEWLDNRKKQRAPETKGAIGQNLEKLAGMAAQSNLSLQEYMREVVRRGWQAFYLIRDAQQAVPQRRVDGRDFDWLTGQ